jgi:hypothetical protein
MQRPQRHAGSSLEGENQGRHDPHEGAGYASFIIFGMTVTGRERGIRHMTKMSDTGIGRDGEAASRDEITSPS